MLECGGVMVQEHAVPGWLAGGVTTRGASFLFSTTAKVGGVVGTSCRAQTGDTGMRAQ